MSSIVTFGEILIRLSTPKGHLFNQSRTFESHFVGSEANVAFNLAMLGDDVHFVSALPDHKLAMGALFELKSSGVNTDYISFHPGRLGLLFQEAGSGPRKPEVVYDRADSAFSLVNPGSYQWANMLTGKNWFHVSGITPGVGNKALKATWHGIDEAQKAGLGISIDLNFRKNLWKEDDPKSFMPRIVQRADVLLCDPTACNAMLGLEFSEGQFSDAQEAIPFFEKLSLAYPNLKYISMILREVHTGESQDIQGIVYHEGELFQSRKIGVTPVTERIGSGDAFMAGLLHQRLENKNAQEMVDFATACCALNMTLKSDFNYFSKADILQVLESNFDPKISR